MAGYLSHDVLFSAFEHQCELEPTAVALETEHEALTYGELGERGHRLARALRARGVGPETRVGVLMERQADLVVALLAILEAGGAYVPLDPAYPLDRLRFMFEDSGCALLLSHGPTAELASRTAKPSLDVDAEREALDASRPPHLPDAAHLAYVIYTSGSTGRPKGVAIAHRSAVALIAWARKVFGRDELSGVLAATSVCFDLSVFEIFLPLSVGGRVILARDALALSTLPERLRRSVTLLNTVPSAAAELVRGGAIPDSVTTVNLAGEPLRSALVEELYAQGRVRKVYNLYGPSEDTTYSTFVRVPREDSGEPSIGRPVTGSRAFVVDPRLRPVEPAGTPGELVLAGDGLARAYLGRAGLTAERFVPDPFSETPGGRLYRTGDRAQSLPSGDLHFLGRLDHQVKVHGFRIELGEIEAAVLRHPAIREAVVVARPDTRGELRLVGYGVNDGAPTREIHEFLAQKLPGYMVPLLWQWLPELPKTPNGKIDRQALPEPTADLDAAGRVAPRTATEEFLIEVWSELLGIDALGIEDDLCELGGHSLILAQVITRVRRGLGVDLSLAEVFDGRTVAMLAERVETARESDEKKVPPISAAPRDGNLPLSFAQERIWFHEHLAPGNLAYNFQFSIRLRGPLSPLHLDGAVTDLIARHELLRTTFPSVEGKPVQIIHEPFEVRIPRVDLGALPDLGARVRKSERALARQLQESFIITELPLIRWVLFRLAADDHVLLQIEHHFVHDGWSIGLIQNELKMLYRDRVAGRPPSLAAPEVQYVDYAIWQRAWFEGEIFERQMRFWKKQLEGSPPVIDLPSDRPRPDAHSFRGAAFFKTLPADLYAGLRAFNRSHETSLFITMLAAFDTWLSRLTGHDDVVLGTGIANRRLRELEDVIGMMVNTLVVCNDLSGNPRFSELLERTRRLMLAIHEHQDMPFEKLVKELRPERHLDHNPLYQVMFSFHDAPMPELDFGGGVRGELSYRHNKSAKADLNVIGVPRLEQHLGHGTGDEDMLVIWEYDTDIFDRTTAQRFWDQYVELLRAAIAQPELRLDALPMISAAERQQLLAEWNDGGPPAIGDENGLHGLVAASVRHHPEAPAVVQGDERLSYGELAARVTALADRLVELGVGPEVRVGLFLDRSVELLVSLLAILEAGGSYVPLDTLYPEERLAFLIEDSRMLALVTTGALVGKLPGLEVPTVLADAVLVETAERASPRPMADAADGRSLAYVIYTSGSTGRPKGVLVEHGSAVNLVRTAIRDFGLGPGNRVLQLASISFDASVLEIFSALGSGATLYLVDPATRLSSEALAAQIESQDIDVVISPPSLLETLPEPRLSGVRTLVVGGEACSLDTFQRWAPGRRFFNCYAPTETTIYSTTQRCDPRTGRAPTLGRPIDGLSVRLLDPRGRLVPRGTVGELYIGGVGLARGYHERAALTAERFVPDPFANEPGAQLYRSGDLARQRATGELEFVGRFDHQVKIRGLRIELGEIEAVLGQHDSVAEVLVLVDSPPGLERRLVAYCVPRTGRPFATGELRRHAIQKLPGYMVPAIFVELEELPISVHGKIDLGALPRPETAVAAAVHVAPTGPVEEALAEIWSDVLGHAEPGATDDFFELGGHSLIAVQVIARIEAAFGLRLPLRALFEGPTLREMAARVAEAMRGGAERLPELRAAPRDERPALSFAQQRMWFLDQFEPGNPSYNIAFAFAIEARGGETLDVELLDRALSSMVERHEALRTRFPATEGQPWQRVEPAPERVLEIVDLRDLGTAEARRRAEERIAAAAGQALDLAEDDLFQARLYRLSPGQDVLFLLTHHIVVDGSARLLLDELSAFYRTLAAGFPVERPAPPVSYVDFTRWQRQWLGGDLLDTQLDFWRRRLGDGVPPLALATDRPRPKVRSSAGEVLEFTLPHGELAGAARALGRRRGATLFMVLASLYESLLFRYADQGDLALGFPIADRPHPHLEGLVGCFVNTLVLRNALDGALRFGELLDRVREATIDAYAHKDVPFEILVDRLTPERDTGRTPFFQVLFVAHGSEPPGLDLGGPESRMWPVPTGGARFDQLLLLRPRGSRLVGRIEYSSDLFDRTTIQRQVDHLGRLAASALADPETRLEDLELLAPSERHQVRVEWNDTARRSAAPDLLHQGFEARADQRPDATALVFDNASGAGSWTYAELEARANLVAHALRLRGVDGGACVGVHLERGPEMVAGLIGVLKAGGTYVPLDAALPAGRVQWILERLGARHALFDATTAEALGGENGSPVEHVLRLDEILADAAATADPGRPLLATPAEQTAYVIFTSGSTGTPKGVAVAHRSAIRLVEWINRDFGVGPSDRVLFLTSIGFDLSVYDVFGLLAAGGSLRVVPQRSVGRPERLIEILEEEPITFWNSAPAALQQLAPVLRPLPESLLRRIFLSGDWIPVDLPDRLRSIFPKAEVTSLGGATEATVWSNVYPIGEVAAHWTSIPYGRPMPDARYHVLDAKLGTCPVGVEGDLSIGGPCLATAYAAEPALTAERFLPDPFGHGERLYATGDRARYFADGHLEFLGRRDHQVKIRGFRVELGEIEHVLRRHPAVGEAVVVARGEERRDRRLAAYAVPRDGASVERDELLSFLAERLPEYMVPAALVVLDALPLSASGKLDRRALPDPGRTGLGLEARSAVPRTEVEKTLVRLWSEILDFGDPGIDDLGVEDDFFELGGHSLLATRLVARLRDVFGIGLPLRSLFENSTLEALAWEVETLQDPGPRLPALEPRPETAGSPLSFAQTRLWLLDRLEPGSAVYNIPFGLSFEGELDVGALERAVEDLVERHESLRTIFPSEDSEPRQELRETPTPLVEPTDLRSLGEAERRETLESLGRDVAVLPFDLERGPLVRFHRVSLSDREQWLYVNMHHAVSDGWSIGIVLRDLAALYRRRAKVSKGVSGSEGAELPELRVQYADFAHWQRSWLRGERLEEQLRYWARYLGGAPRLLPLPTDRPRPAVLSYAGGRHSLRLPGAVVTALRGFTRARRATLFMGLLTIFEAFLGHLTGEDDVVVGTPIAGRRVSGVEDLIGFFVNTLVMRGRGLAARTFESSLDLVRRDALDAYGHQDLPFEQLVEELQPERDLAYTPLFQAFFALQTPPPGEVDLGGARLRLEPIATGLSKFALSLELEEVEDGARGAFTYHTDLFDAGTIARFAGYFENLLGAALDDPKRPLGELSLLSPAETTQLLQGAADAGGATALDSETYAGGVYHRVELEDGRQIARPLEGLNALVLSQDLRPRGIGLDGELCLVGFGSAGDVDLPELVVRRFVSDPWSDDPERRLYRTGEAARRLTDGRIEVHGRLDSLAQVGATWIDRAEVEEALASHPDVEDARVLTRGDTLTAYVLPAGGRLEADDLRAFLELFLDPESIPDAYLLVDAWPKTPNGAVDEEALSALDPAALEARRAEAARAMTPHEELLAGVWSELLGVEPEVDGNFFELGGHSLLAMQMLSRIQRLFGIQIGLQVLFQRPVLEDLALRLVELQRDAAAEWPEIEATPAAAGEEVRAPMSFFQERLWVVERLDPGRSTYNTPAALWLEGELDEAALRRAVGAIVRRHGALRTRFGSDGGEPVQWVSPEVDDPMTTIDLGHLPGEERLEVARALAFDEARRPFDLGRATLMRIRLIRLEPGVRVFVLNMHHIVSDGWSVNVFYRELAEHYDAFLRGTAPAPAPLPIQYTDFSRWQRAGFEAGLFDDQLAAWIERLDGAPPELELPLDRPRPRVQTFRGRQLVRTVPEASVAELERLAKSQGVTFFMALLGVFTAVLGRWTGQRDVVVGTSVANRDRPELEGLIGFFVNTLVLRTGLGGRPSFAEILERTRETVLHATSHGDLPFERLVDAVNPQRDLRRSPLFQVMFSYHRSAVEERQLTGVSLRSFAALDSGTAKFDFSLIFHHGREGLQGIFEYNTDLFDTRTVERLADAFQLLLDGAATRPESRLAELPFLTETERRQLAVWNATARDRRPAHAHVLFAERAAAHPEAPAILWQGRAMSYGALEERANRLAHHLRSLGVGGAGESAPVAILLPRTPELVVALLAVLKAGGGFLPLPVDQPAQRLSEILRDSRAQVIVTRAEAVSASLGSRRLAVLVSEVVDLGADAHTLAERPAEPPEHTTAEADLAYVIYTSGSTGKPKGTLVPHGGLAHYLAWCRESYLHETGGAPVFTSVSFDLTLTSLLAPLTAGHPLSLLDEAHPLAALAEAWRAEGRWAFVKLTPAHLQLLGHELSADEKADKTLTLVLGGEALTYEHLESWRRDAPQTRLVNEYGPTEAVVGCTTYEVRRDDPERGPVAIGRPIDGVQARILGPDLELCGFGTPGELCIAGDGLARGYLDRPGLTARAFIPDPQGETPGRRLYRTGDLARWRADGEMEFLGRLDHQVKFLGYRVEPGEIEAAIVALRGVREAAVMLRTDLPGGPRLVAWWVPASAPQSDEADALARVHEAMHAALKVTLPEYMVPGSFVRLDALPLDRHGKLDRRALPAPTGLTAPAPRSDTRPANELEETVAEVLRRVLGLDAVGMDDNFFDLGAKSLTLVQVHDELVARGQRLSVVDLFRAPTVRALAERLVHGESDEEARSAVETQVKARGAASEARRARRQRRRGGSSS